MREESGTGEGRYSAKRTVVPINFSCFAPKAKKVAIIGDFNHWSGDDYPMERMPDGAWHLQVAMHSGQSPLPFPRGWRTATRSQGKWGDAHGRKCACVLALSKLSTCRHIAFSQRSVTSRRNLSFCVYCCACGRRIP